MRAAIATASMHAATFAVAGEPLAGSPPAASLAATPAAPRITTSAAPATTAPSPARPLVPPLAPPFAPVRTANDSFPAAAIESAARAALNDALAAIAAARNATVRVAIAPFDARRTVLPCAAMSGFIPPGARLSGRTLVGVRCTAGASWQLFVPAEVRVTAPAWRAAAALKPGRVLTESDLVPAPAELGHADLELGGDARGIALIPATGVAPIGRTVARAVASGAALAGADLLDDARMNAGDTVRVVYEGDGFAIASEGRLVGAAGAGKAAQVRLASGTIVRGIARADRAVVLAR